MRKHFQIRLKVPDHIGQELHQLALAESRSDSGMINLLVHEALDARRARAAEQQELLTEGQRAVVQRRLTSLLRGEAAEQ
jgi:hypothetical protein